jgi:DNA-3-methyladenine glycosylase II
MHDKALTARLNSNAALAVHLDALMRHDPRLAAIREASGDFPVRVNPAGFVGIAKIICGQQLSVASARAIWGRFEAVPGALDPAGYLALDEAAIRATGFSLAKYRTVRVIAEAVVAGELDFAHVERLPAEAAVAYLTAHKGIGPWTAEIYLMFCAGHPDVFPAGDLALQKAVAHGLGLDARPSIKQLIEIALAWSPHRAAAALLFWRYYAVIRDKEGIIL